MSSTLPTQKLFVYCVVVPPFLHFLPACLYQVPRLEEITVPYEYINVKKVGPELLELG